MMGSDEDDVRLVTVFGSGDGVGGCVAGMDNFLWESVKEASRFCEGKIM